MTRIAILTAILLSTSPASGEVDEATKVAALRLGYILNGNSMVRWGSIDLSKPITAPCTNCSPITIPPKEKLR